MFLKEISEERVKRILLGAVECGRVANAYLFTGGSSADKESSAKAFAKLLNCNHPDIFLIEPARRSLGAGGKEGTSIKIDQIRNLKEMVKYGPSTSSYLLAIIKDADLMTPDAANSFLKILEEPREGVVFVLLTEREDAIPKTIISRCQRILFSRQTPPPLEGEAKFVYDELKNLKGKDIAQILDLSQRVEDVEETLNTILFYLSGEADFKAAKIIFDALKSIKRKANLRLTLDIMFLKLAGVIDEEKISN